jgi:hypothetical protein
VYVYIYDRSSRVKTIYGGLLGNSAAGVVLWLSKLCMYIYTDDRSSRVKLSMADPRAVSAAGVVL